MATIQDYANKSKDGVIQLGTANGWSSETNEIYRDLSSMAIPGSHTSENLGRCYEEYTFKVEIDGSIYTVVHQVDSSD